MLTAIIYFIDSVVIGLFCYKSFTFRNRESGKNLFAGYFFWASLIIALSFLKSSILITVHIYWLKLSGSDLLFWSDIIGRALFYLAAAISIGIPFEKIYPNRSNHKVISYTFLAVGGLLIIYQLIFRNHPVLSESGIVNWDAGFVLSAGMAILFIIPWAITALLFISDFIRSKFTLYKQLLLGLGFLLVCIGAVFQDSSLDISGYVTYGLVLLAGFLFLLAGILYKTRVKR